MSIDAAFEISCEFFPPRTDKGAEKLRTTKRQLDVLQPKFYSVTFGAGGSTQEKTLETVLDIQSTGTPAAPHLSCVGSTNENIRNLLNKYKNNGIQRIVALRGDKPSGWAGDLGELRYANELIEFIRRETGDYFHLEVAAYPEFHPQAHTPSQDIDYFCAKVKAGANSAITQYFYNTDAYFHFVEACQQRGIDIPIIPGIMPITNYEQIVRFSDMCGAEVPRWIRQQLQAKQEQVEDLKAFGLDVVTRLCEKLIQGGVPGLHFYTLNQAATTLEIARRLGLSTK